MYGLKPVPFKEVSFAVAFLSLSLFKRFSPDTCETTNHKSLTWQR
jgi:hypothetical protein